MKIAEARAILGLTLVELSKHADFTADQFKELVKYDLAESHNDRSLMAAILDRGSFNKRALERIWVTIRSIATKQRYDLQDKIIKLETIKDYYLDKEI